MKPVKIPFNTIGSDVMLLSHWMSFQVTDGSKREFAYSFSFELSVDEEDSEDFSVAMSKFASLEDKIISNAH